MNLAELRFDAGLTQAGLADLVGIAGRTIARIENGQRPTPAVAKKLADHFGVKATDLWPVEAKAEAA